MSQKKAKALRRALEQYGRIVEDVDRSRVASERALEIASEQEENSLRERVSLERRLRAALRRESSQRRSEGRVARWALGVAIVDLIGMRSWRWCCCECGGTACRVVTPYEQGIHRRRVSKGRLGLALGAGPAGERGRGQTAGAGEKDRPEKPVGLSGKGPGGTSEIRRGDRAGGFQIRGYPVCGGEVEV